MHQYTCICSTFEREIFSVGNKIETLLFTSSMCTTTSVYTYHSIEAKIMYVPVFSTELYHTITAWSEGNDTTCHMIVKLERWEMRGGSHDVI